MIIKQKSDIEPKKTSIGIIYGLAGIGKTTLSGQSGLLIDLEEGALRSGATAKVAQEANLKDILDIIRNSDFKNISIDTGDELVRLISTDCKTENPKLQSASQTLRLYGALLDKLIFFIGECRKSEKNIVFVCHGKKDESTDTQRYIPRFGSENNNIELFKVCDFIGYMYAQGNDRYITFDPSDFNNCKNSLQIPNQKVTRNTDIFKILEAAQMETALDFEAKKEKISEFKELVKAATTAAELDEIGKKLRKENAFDNETIKLFNQRKDELQ